MPFGKVLSLNAGMTEHESSAPGDDKAVDSQ